MAKKTQLGCVCGDKRTLSTRNAGVCLQLYTTTLLPYGELMAGVRECRCAGSTLSPYHTKNRVAWLAQLFNFVTAKKTDELGEVASRQLHSFAATTVHPAAVGA